ncbi:MAG: molybdenum cofactor guanylyltransferase [Asticcacaulis sp.]
MKALSASWGIAILAGGEGRRIGGKKPERYDMGIRLIDRALSRAEAWGAPMALCLKNPEQIADLPPSLTVLLDPPGEAGPTGGLVSALSWARGLGLNGILIMPCDMPDLHEGLWAHLLAEAVRDGSEDAVCFMPIDEMGFCPVLSLWRASALEGVIAALAVGRTALKHLIADLDGRHVRVPEGWLGRNVNAPEDLRPAIAVS